MEELIARVCARTGVDEATAKIAIGHVLLFMRDQAPESNVAELIDRTPLAREAVEGAAAASDTGVTAAIGTLTELMGFGQTSLNILCGKLNNLGLSETQIRSLLQEVFAHAEKFVGREGVTKMTSAVPYLSEFMKKTSGGEGARRGA